MSIGGECIEFDKVNIGKMLYSKRMELNLSQEQMAEKCCISVRQYIDLENSKRIPMLETFINITIACDMDIGVFIHNLIESGYEITDDKNARQEKK